MKQAFVIHGMHCAGCSARVQRMFSALPEVTSAEVDLPSGTVTLEVTAPLPEEKLREQTEALGFDFGGELRA